MTPLYAPTHHPAPPCPPHRTNPTAAVLVALTTVPFLSGCAANTPQAKPLTPAQIPTPGRSAATKPPPPPAPEPERPAKQASGHTVTYRITGTASTVSVTFSSGSPGDVSQNDDVPAPWTKTLQLPNIRYLYLSAHNTTPSGTVSCEITVDGDLVQSNTTTGPNPVATCSHSQFRPAHR